MREDTEDTWTDGWMNGIMIAYNDERYKVLCKTDLKATHTCSHTVLTCWLGIPAYICNTAYTIMVLQLHNN